VIHLVGEDARSVPNWFRRRLRDIDPALVVYFNPFKQQFCIDRCVRGSDCLSEKHVECEKTNVMLFPHMGEAALEKLKSMDAWTNFGSLENQRRERENAKAEWDAKTDAEIRELHGNAAKDDKAQLHKVYDLIKQFDTARVH
jgi:hypothetical protein